RTIEVDGVRYPLSDSHFPTLDPADPYELSEEERQCVDHLRHSFVSSQKLGEHMQYLVSQGSMYLVRDGCLIFHGCVPVDSAGEFQAMSLDDRPLGGREL